MKDNYIRHSEKLQLLPDDELQLRLGRLRDNMEDAGCDSVLISDNANIYYLTGRVFAGYVYYNAADREPYYIVRRPNNLQGGRMMHLGRFNELIDLLTTSTEITRPKHLGIELNYLSYNSARRLLDALEGKMSVVNGSPIMRASRSVKTACEQDLMRESGLRHERVYSRIPHIFQPGMTDIELQIEVERQSRLEDCLGIFRINGHDMEIFMGNVITGENADYPTPYDFAMGGAGLDPSLPVGADGSIIEPGHTVMVDVNGNFTGYMTDMSRCYAPESPAGLNQKLLDAHQLSIDIVHTLTDMARPGVAARDLYEKAIEMVRKAGMTDYFMGHRQQAAFVCHGVGIEINESPVISPRSRDILQGGNTLALEPKFVIPGYGPAGIENTIIVKNDNTAAECITNAPEQIIYFE